MKVLNRGKKTENNFRPYRVVCSQQKKKLIEMKGHRKKIQPLSHIFFITINHMRLESGSTKCRYKTRMKKK